LKFLFKSYAVKNLKKRGLGRKDCFLPKDISFFAEGKGTLRKNHQGFSLKSEHPENKAEVKKRQEICIGDRRFE